MAMALQYEKNREPKTTKQNNKTKQRQITKGYGINNGINNHLFHRLCTQHNNIRKYGDPCIIHSYIPYDKQTSKTENSKTEGCWGFVWNHQRATSQRAPSFLQGVAMGCLATLMGEYIMYLCTECCYYFCTCTHHPNLQQ